jgi:hypothetical protein
MGVVIRDRAHFVFRCVCATFAWGTFRAATGLLRQQRDLCCRSKETFADKE